MSGLNFLLMIGFLIKNMTRPKSAWRKVHILTRPIRIPLIIDQNLGSKQSKIELKHENSNLLILEDCIWGCTPI